MQKKYGLGWFLGWYSYSFDGDKHVYARIIYLDLLFCGKHTLKHEMGHHQITSKCTSFGEAFMLNSVYDKLTWHGILQFRAWKWLRLLKRSKA